MVAEKKNLKKVCGQPGTVKIFNHQEHYARNEFANDVRQGCKIGYRPYAKSPDKTLIIFKELFKGECWTANAIYVTMGVSG